MAFFLFTLLFLVSAIASNPVRIKRLALNSEGPDNLDYCLEQNVVRETEITCPLISLRTARVAPETHRFLAGRDIVSANIYRGPPVRIL